MFESNIWRRNPMFLMSWTRTRSRADRRRCGDSGFLSLMTPPRLLPAGIQKMDLDRDTGTKDGLGRVAIDAHDDLEGPARGVHARADELDGAGGLDRREAVRDDLDLVALANLEEVALLHVDAGEKRLGRDDLEERLGPGFGDLLARARGLVCEQAAGRG